MDGSKVLIGAFFNCYNRVRNDYRHVFKHVAHNNI